MDKNKCCITVSLGELYDKYTILLIKLERIIDETKQYMVKIELEYLKYYVDKFNLDSHIINELKKINETLWDIENKIRIKEKNNEFDDEFIKLARGVYITNDIRSKFKNKINNILNSELTDIKSY